MIVASREAAFGLPEVKRGLVAAGGGLMRLPARVPYYLAMEWCLTGAMIPAAQAHKIALVNRLTEPGHALGGAMELGRGDGARAGGLRERAAGRPGYQAGHRRGTPVGAVGDVRGALAFKEKRAPRWRGV